MDKQETLDALTALSQETRLDVFRLLVKSGTGGLPAGAIADSLGVRQNTMSSHLGILSRAGLVEKIRDGRVIRYNANYSRMRSLLTFLMEDCCQGNAAICAPMPRQTRRSR